MATTLEVRARIHRARLTTDLLPRLDVFLQRAAAVGAPGMPGTSVNLSNFNFLVQDTAFAYSGRGPQVYLQRTYNADDSDEGAFGRSWTFNYKVELVEEPGGDVNIKRESGKMDFFNFLGGGTYSPPLWSHDILVKNADGTWDLRVKRTRLTQRFDTLGKLTNITDRNGNAVTLQYEGNGRLQTVADGAGRTTTFFYGANGKINRVVDPAGREATYTYDASTNLVGTTDMVGNVVTYTYDANSYMTTLVVPKGTYQIINIPYNEAAFGLVISSITDPPGNRNTYSTPGNIIVEVLDANGNAWKYLPDGNGEVREITDPLENKTGFTFNSSGERTNIIDAKETSRV